MNGTSPEISLADDLLEGCGAIAEFLYGTSAKKRAVHYLVNRGRLPIFRHSDSTVCMRKSTYLRWVEEQERASTAGKSWAEARGLASRNLHRT